MICYRYSSRIYSKLPRGNSDKSANFFICFTRFVEHILVFLFLPHTPSREDGKKQAFSVYSPHKNCYFKRQNSKALLPYGTRTRPSLL